MPNIQKAYNWAIQTCNAPDVGYSQTYRYQQTVNGITYYDCSSFISYALIAGDFPVPYIFTTHVECDILLSLGFTEEPISGEWKAGDVVWRSGHTEMVYEGGIGGGITMGAHWDEVPLPDQVSINNNPTSNFSRIFRYGSGADPDTGFGSSQYVVAAICGNWMQESGVNPERWQNGYPKFQWDKVLPESGGYGVGQWTNTSSTNMRLQLLHNYYLDGHYTSWGKCEMDYFIHENTWYYHPSLSYAYAYHDLTEFLQSSSTSMYDLTRAFMEGWEGITVNYEWAMFEQRLSFANTALAVIAMKANDTTITDWISGDRSLNGPEIENNIIMVYRYLSSGGGGGGTPTPEKINKLTIWQMIRYHF